MKFELISENNMPTKKGNVKSIKVSSEIHLQIKLLGMFMDEGKTSIILKKIVDSYLIHEFTDRQQQLFNSMKEVILSCHKNTDIQS